MIYVCVPTHNEGRTVGVLLWKISQVLKSLGRDFELLLLDDASTDNTQQVLDPYRRVLPLTILRHAERQGYGISLETLLRLAVSRSAYPKRDMVVTVQADFTEDPDDILMLIKRMEAGADVVAASVALPEDASRTLRWSHRAAGYLARRFGIGEEGPEALATLRAYRIFPLRKAIEAAGGRQIVHGPSWSANAQLLRAVKPFGRRIDVVPSSLHPERRQRDSRFSGWPALQQFFQLRHTAETPAFRGNVAVLQSRAASGMSVSSSAPGRDSRGRPGRGDRPDRAERPGRGQRPERSQRSERPDRPARERPDRPRSAEGTQTRPPRAPRPADREVRLVEDAPGRRPEGRPRRNAANPAAEGTLQADAGAGAVAPGEELELLAETAGDAVAPAKRRRRGPRRRGKKRDAGASQDQMQAELSGSSDEAEGTSEEPGSTSEEGSAEAPAGATKRRRRRGGRRRRRGEGAGRAAEGSAAEGDSTDNSDFGPPDAPEDSRARGDQEPNV